MLYTKDFADPIEVYFPCELLVYNICYGTYYCGCENGYWRETYGASKASRLEQEQQSKAAS